MRRTSSSEREGERVARDLILELVRTSATGMGDRRCPRCGCAQIHRWGSFSGRQRFMCSGCRRTFSDLTGTPLARCRRLACWMPYLEALDDRLSIRASAVRSRIHPSTAFRWRHIFLSQSGRVHGTVGFERCVASSARIPVCWPKAGVRSPTPADWAGVPRVGAEDQKGRGRVNLARKTWVAVFHGTHSVRRTPTVALVAIPSARQIPDAKECDLALNPWVAESGVVTCRGPVFSQLTGLVGLRGRSRIRIANHLRLVGTDADIAPCAERVARGLRGWFSRFRGISGRYLANYLEWRRIVEPPWRLDDSLALEISPIRDPLVSPSLRVLSRILRWHEPGRT